MKFYYTNRNTSNHGNYITHIYHTIFIQYSFCRNQDQSPTKTWLSNPSEIFVLSLKASSKQSLLSGSRQLLGEYISSSIPFQIQKTPHIELIIFAFLHYKGLFTPSKSGIEAKKTKRQPNDQRINDKHQRKISLALAFCTVWRGLKLCIENNTIYFEKTKQLRQV